MRILLFSRRTMKELLRDPINLLFGLGFPLVLLLLLSVINANIPPEANNPLFSIQNLAPGIATFGPVFMALFSGMLLSKDRTSSFLMRLFTSPMTSADFILGYTLPMILFAVAQSIITFAAATAFGFSFSVNTLLAVVVLVPVTVMFVGVGLLCGSLMNDKAVGAVCGALLTNVAGWLSGIWFPLDLVGGTFRTVSEALPFYHAAEAVKAAANGNYGGIMSHLAVVVVYATMIYAVAVAAFRQKMSSDS